MKKTIQFDGYQLHLIPTQKFKNVTISLKLASPLTKETSTIRTLLSFMLAGGTKKYPSTQLLSSYLEELYGAGFSSTIGSKGKAHIIHLFETCVDQQYLTHKDNLLEKQIELLHDIFFNPNAKEGKFNETVLKQKKQELKWRLQSLKDDKFSYSLEKMLELMGENQVLGISTFGYEEEIDQITAKDLYDYFQKCIQEDIIDIYVVGDIDENIVEIFKRYLPFVKRDYLLETDLYFTSPRQDLLVEVEKQDITQAKLNMGYEIQTKFSDLDHYAFTVFNGIFGGFAHSLLFKVVREMHSLCYSISSSYDAFNGIMIVNAGIETKDYQKTVDLINEQLSRIQTGDFSDDLIEITKMMLENSLIKSNDEAMNIIALRYNRDITHKEETNEQYIQKLNAVSKEDIIRVSKKVKLNTIFLLARKED